MYKLGNVYFVDFRHEEKSRIYEILAVGVAVAAIAYGPCILFNSKNNHGDLEKAVIRNEKLDKKDELAKVI